MHQTSYRHFYLTCNVVLRKKKDGTRANNWSPVGYRFMTSYRKLRLILWSRLYGVLPTVKRRKESLLCCNHVTCEQKTIAIAIIFGNFPRHANATHLHKILLAAIITLFKTKRIIYGGESSRYFPYLLCTRIAKKIFSSFGQLTRRRPNERKNQRERSREVIY